MELDKQLLFSQDQAIGVVGSTPSTFDVDLLTTGAGVAREMVVVATVTTAFTSGGSATLLLRLITSASPTFATSTVLLESLPMPASALWPGAPLIQMPLPIDGASGAGLQRYLRLLYVIANAAMSTGTITTALMPAAYASKWFPYAAGADVSRI